MKSILLDEWSRRADEITLQGAAAHRVRDVLRLKPGDLISAGDGRGTRFELRISSIGPDVVVCAVEGEASGSGEPSLAVTLAVGLPRGSRMEIVVQKATELGVTRIVPLLAERGMVRPGEGNHRQRRWEKIAAEAVIQCRRARAPQIDSPRPLSEFLGEPPLGPRLLLDTGGVTHPFVDLDIGMPRAISLLVGPEGGFSPHEHAACLAGACLPVRLGPRVLRVETACLASLALVMHRWGDLR